MLSLQRAIVIGILFYLTIGAAKAQVVLICRDAPTTLSPTLDSDMRQFSVTISGFYSLYSITDGFDNSTTLYFTPFTSRTPLSNIIVTNDDLGSFRTSAFDTELTADVNSTLVTTTFSATVRGGPAML